MDLNWVQSILYGFVSGIGEILPVSARAHNVLLLKFYGVNGGMELMDLLIHLGIFGGLYFSNQGQLLRFSRARALARIPKRRRKRPLDIRTLMDYSMLKTMLVPAVLGLLAYRYTENLEGKLAMVALFLFLNGIILYLPQFFPTGNKDSRTLSRLEGFFMGLGGALSVLPGISAVGAMTSVSSLCGVERTYGLNMALLVNMIIIAGLAVYDGMALVAAGLGMVSFWMVLRCLVTALAALGGTLAGVRFMRFLASRFGFSLFGLYCFGLALFTFILNLMA